jgi:hypothetical protein
VLNERGWLIERTNQYDDEGIIILNQIHDIAEQALDEFSGFGEPARE